MALKCILTFATHDGFVLVARLVWHSWHCSKLVQIFFPLAVSVSNATTISPPNILASVVSPKAQFSALYSLSCTQPRPVLV